MAKGRVSICCHAWSPNLRPCLISPIESLNYEGHSKCEFFFPRRRDIAKSGRGNLREPEGTWGNLREPEGTPGEDSFLLKKLFGLAHQEYCWEALEVLGYAAKWIYPARRGPTRQVSLSITNGELGIHGEYELYIISYKQMNRYTYNIYIYIYLFFYIFKYQMCVYIYIYMFVCVCACCIPI